MVVDRGVEVGVSDSLSTGHVSSSVGPPSATSRNLAELFDVDVDQLTRNSFLVAADDPPVGGCREML